MTKPFLFLTIESYPEPYYYMNNDIFHMAFLGVQCRNLSANKWGFYIHQRRSDNCNDKWKKCCYLNSLIIYVNSSLIYISISNPLICIWIFSGWYHYHLLWVTQFPHNEFEILTHLYLNPQYWCTPQNSIYKK